MVRSKKSGGKKGVMNREVTGSPIDGALLRIVEALEGNSAAFSYGIVRGLGRFFARLGYGLYDTLLFPIPTYKGTYAPPYKSNVQWMWRGYSEFPPELMFETRYPYVRNDQEDP